ncbi:hypothetical protein V1264_006776 [Littorina saxatilis]|uniref:Uncharacterized protein n=2 Tax=Littorina saxatilis TaxID=31220 RepID=A0AAN9G4V5_9CAEN
MQRIIADDPQLRQDLCQCLQVGYNVDPVPFCLTSDDLATPSQWWQRRMADAGTDPAMSDDAYLDLIARLARPGSKVTVNRSQTPRVSQTPRRTRDHYIRMNTTGEAVVETANRFTPAHVVLHPLQVEILNLELPRLFLTGPPGTGICIMLVLKGLEWLRQGNQVHVISTWYGSEASSHLIVSQMKQMAGPDGVHLIRMHSLDLDQDDLAASEALVIRLADTAVEGQLFLVANEVFNEATVDRPFTDFCDSLLSRVPGLHLWSASQYPDYGPPMLTQKVLTEPLRIPPSVTRQLQQCGYTGQDREVLGYTEAIGPLPSDGLVPIELVHAGDGHSAFEAPDCVQCGQEVGRTLKRLHIDGLSLGKGRPENPRYRDVLILSRGNVLHDEKTDATGNVTHAASGFIQGLRESGIPVTVLARGDAAGLRDLATMAGPDHVVAAFCADVKDLERKIVVWVQSSEFRQGEDEGRRQACGCCSSQLVFVRPPPDQEYPSSDDGEQ